MKAGEKAHSNSCDKQTQTRPKHVIKTLKSLIIQNSSAESFHGRSAVYININLSGYM